MERREPSPATKELDGGMRWWILGVWKGSGGAEAEEAGWAVEGLEKESCGWSD